MTRRRLLIGAAATGALFAAMGASPVSAHPPIQIEEPPPGKALIVFYRRWAYPGAAISYIVREDKAELGRLSAGSYFIATVEPGLHTFTVRAERHSNMQLVAEAGEIYYVRFELDLGVILYQPDLTPSEQRLFDEISDKLHLSEPLDGAAIEAAPASAAKP